MSRQDVENFAPHRIEMVGELAQKLGFTQVIVFGHAQECGTVITTWGDTAEHSAQAAAGANNIKRNWGWPKDTLVESEKVKALRARIAELERMLLGDSAFGGGL